MAEIVHFTKATSAYEWVIEADIEACFDRIDHGQLLPRSVGFRVVRCAALRCGQSQARSARGPPRARMLVPWTVAAARDTVDRRLVVGWLPPVALAAMIFVASAQPDLLRAG